MASCNAHQCLIQHHHFQHLQHHHHRRRRHHHHHHPQDSQSMFGENTFRSIQSFPHLCKLSPGTLSSLASKTEPSLLKSSQKYCAVKMRRCRNGSKLVAAASGSTTNLILLDSFSPLNPTPAIDFTYSDENDEWLNKEEARLLSTKSNFDEGVLLTRGRWRWDDRELQRFCFSGKMQFMNITKSNEIFICEVHGNIVLLSSNSIDGIEKKMKFIPNHHSVKKRNDDYWQSFILKAQEKCDMNVWIEISSNDPDKLSDIIAMRIDVLFISYGPKGRIENHQNVVLPLNFVAQTEKNSNDNNDVGINNDLKWKIINKDLKVLPVKTHLLCHQDDPKTVLKMYIKDKIRKNDIVTLGETPLALMEGRFRNPKSIKPSLVAMLACKFFHPTSSLATACGMQSLIDLVGKLRVIFAVLGAIFARLFGIRGMFYNLAGSQARLIDDVTGTIPPYDQFITLGPLHAKYTVESLKAEIGCEIAIVDVNDLKKVQILAATNGVDEKSLVNALISNPAGNADEQTPIVIVRGASVNK